MYLNASLYEKAKEQRPQQRKQQAKSRTWDILVPAEDQWQDESRIGSPLPSYRIQRDLQNKRDLRV